MAALWWMATLFVCIITNVGAQDILKIGVLEPPYTSNDANYSLYAIAAQYVKYKNILPSSVDMQLIFNDNTGPAAISIIQAIDMVRTYDVHGVVGSDISTQSENIQIILSYYQVPQISDWSTSTELSNKNNYPYFLRTIPADDLQAHVLIQTLVEMKWGYVVFAYTSDSYGIGGRNAFLPLASAYNITCFPISLTIGNTDFTAEAQQAKGTKYHITIMFTQADEADYYMQAANKTGMVGPDYVYIYSDSVTDSLLNNYGDVNITYPLYDGSILVSPHQGIGSLYNSVLDFMNKTLDADTFDLITENQSWYSFDCVYAFAVACANLLKQGVPISDIKGEKYLNALKSLHILGTTGNITFNQNGDRVGYYDVENFHNLNDTKVVGLYDPETNNITFSGNLVFFGGSTRTPSDYDVCVCVQGVCINGTCKCTSGYSGERCDVVLVDNRLSTGVIIAIVVPTVVALFVIFFVVYYIYQRNRRRLVQNVELNQRSKIDRPDLHLTTKIGSGAMGDVFKASLRGSEVAAKRLVATNMSRDMMEAYALESAMMCGLRHPNIVLFMGSCHDKATKEMFLVMELMTRGSLHDILHNKSISLSYEMQIHIASQAAQGVNFLHQSSPPIIHRDLKSHNILLDEKWAAKISDFGMTKTKENAQKHNAQSNFNGNELGTIYWTAPEVLNGGHHSEESDAYAFGIILWEIFHRDTPFGTRDPMSVALDVAKKRLRPSLNPNIPSDVSALITQCWSHNPDDRPSFTTIVKTLRTISSGQPNSTLGEISSDVVAPTINAYLVQTRVENASALWDDIPSQMIESMLLHNDLIRAAIKKHKGYEVEYKNHGFFVVFAKVEQAINFCLEVQNALLAAPWPYDLAQHDAAKREEDQDGNVLRFGLRVNMAINFGNPEYATSQQNGRTHYFGKLVEKLPTYLNFCKGGEIVTIPDVVNSLEAHTNKLICPITSVLLSRAGEETLGSSSSMQMLHEIVPAALKQRLAKNAHSEPLPNSVFIDMESPNHEANDDASNLPKFAIAHSTIRFGDRLGRGSLGENVMGIWSQRQVAVKTFVAQAFDEISMFRLMANVSLMTKLRHPNLVGVYGACLDPGHIAIVSEFIPRGNLRQILSDNSNQIDSKRKLAILRDIAQGMAYLSKQDPRIAVHKDLKSPKLLVGNDWSIKISGFGLDVIKEAVRTMTSIGAAPWTAPEVWTDPALESHYPASVYAFGIIMWELLTRQVPFDKRHPMKLCDAVIHGERPPVPANSSPSYASLMQKCWSAQPEARPTFEAILIELDHVQL